MVVASCSCEQLPLLKILCHAAKHPQATVNGLLLGKASASGVVVSDAVPLFHNSHGLAAPTEVAMSQVEAYTAEAGRPQIVGYYHCDAAMQSAEAGPIPRRIADGVASKHPGSVLVLLDNKKLGVFLAQGSAGVPHPFELFTHEGKGWKREVPEAFTVGGSGGAENLRESFSGMLRACSHRALADFEEHLDDVSKDWTNPRLGKTSLAGQLH
ncbi:hypothetical protein FOA52_013345 [Chlamydomonas sp. UWO 241]|nr:hypothetical protein FOA52_013345 [Chlamydomonas sp. UWO 241]